MKLAVLSTCFALLTATEAFAWGASGHSIVGEIAQRHLTPRSGDNLRMILGGDVSLASLGSWADDYKFTAPGLKTKPWHFVDVDVKKDTYSQSTDCPDGSCLPEALTKQIAILSNAKLAPELRRNALLFIVHLTGDMSQPFHCSEKAGDGGGNAIKADFEGNGPDGKKRSITQTNMHAIWDEALVDSHAWSWGSYAEELNVTVASMTPSPVYTNSSINDWINECHVTGQAVYKLTPQPNANGVVIIGPDYQKTVQGTLDRQLARGGLQLAAILNAALANGE
jgi:hypothetical protein